MGHFSRCTCSTNHKHKYVIGKSHDGMVVDFHPQQSIGFTENGLAKKTKYSVRFLGEIYQRNYFLYFGLLSVFCCFSVWCALASLPLHSDSWTFLTDRLILATRTVTAIGFSCPQISTAEAGGNSLWSWQRSVYWHKCHTEGFFLLGLVPNATGPTAP